MEKNKTMNQQNNHKELKTYQFMDNCGMLFQVVAESYIEAAKIARAMCAA